MALKREVISNYPIEAYIEPTSFCNLRCPACPTGLRLGERPVTNIDESLFKAAIDEIGDYVFRLWMYNWGEPLLHRQTPELIKYAKTKALEVLLSSNLSIPMTDDYIERLVRSGLDTLIVSLDGTTAETYQKYRISGSFALVRENMQRIQETKKRLGLQTPHVLWQFLVFKHNEHEIAKAESVFREWGADSLKVAPAEMPLEPYRAGFEPSTLPQYNMYHSESDFVRESERQMSAGKSCSWLYGTFVLNPNGNVSACCGVSAEKNDFGRYAKGDDFFTVWNNSKFKAARKLFVQFGKTRNGEPPNALKQQEMISRIDGMAMGLNHSLAQDELICNKCPIPFRQDDVRLTILDITYMLAHTLRHDPSLKQKLRSVVAYALMGAPYWQRLVDETFQKVTANR